MRYIPALIVFALGILIGYGLASTEPPPDVSLESAAIVKAVQAREAYHHDGKAIRAAGRD